MLHALRSNAGLLISLLLLMGCAVACTLLAILMKRAGASLKPIAWFAGFFGLIVLPQFLWHFGPAFRSQSRFAKATSAGPVAASSSLDLKSLFGPDADPQLVTDIRQSYGDCFTRAEFAKFAVLPGGETILLAQFPDYASAERAWVEYQRVSGLNQLRGEGDSQRGYLVTRPTGDRTYIVHMSDLVAAWTGRDDSVISQRMRAGGFNIPPRSPLLDHTGRPESERLLPIQILALGLIAYLFVVFVYFFKGAAWAGTIHPQVRTAPISASELRERLTAINALDLPFQLESGSTPNELMATWRYADAKWMDLARLQGMRRTFRIRLAFDETRKTVRTTDYLAAYDWALARQAAEIRWAAALGIVFFQYEQQRVFGLKIDPGGGFKPDLSYAYTFQIHELKAPLIQAVTSAGWTWRPTVWHGPAWLRWLTE